ncbi:hypothetical protein ACQPYK_27260 [Streptosporangium sp. CA-135522]|uniref:hypothetical protein n=1 Tax=Streptosporangium sp. CA-135522 TaxID=3240072 RepID=UPI003D9160C7
MRVLDRWVGSTRSPDRLALATRCHALLAAPGEAEERFRDALDLHHRGLCEFETARTQLLFGSALRRNRRSGAAREHLGFSYLESVRVAPDLRRNVGCVSVTC